MPDGTEELGALLGELTTRAIVEPVSRNRPINLYVTNYEEFIVTQDTKEVYLADLAVQGLHEGQGDLADEIPVENLEHRNRELD